MNGLRNENDILLQQSKINNTFQDHAATLFNDLPIDIRRIDTRKSYPTFCKRLKEYLFDKSMARTLI